MKLRAIKLYNQDDIGGTNISEEIADSIESNVNQVDESTASAQNAEIEEPSELELLKQEIREMKKQLQVSQKQEKIEPVKTEKKLTEQIIREIGKAPDPLDDIEKYNDWNIKFQESLIEKKLEQIREKEHTIKNTRELEKAAKEIEKAVPIKFNAQSAIETWWNNSGYSDLPNAKETFEAFLQHPDILKQNVINYFNSDNGKKAKVKNIAGTISDHSQQTLNNRKATSEIVDPEKLTYEQELAERLNKML